MTSLLSNPNITNLKAVELINQSDAVKKGIEAGNIRISDGEQLELSEFESASKKRDQEILAHFERKKLLKSIIVPTDDSLVKKQLREFGEPIILFGENPVDRRERLKNIIIDRKPPQTDGNTSATSDQLSSNAATSDISVSVQNKAGKEEYEIWYHEGPPQLKDCRYWLAEYSLRRARERLNDQRLYHQQHALNEERTKQRQSIQKTMSNLSNLCSQIGDTRPVAFCNFSPDSSMVATASWSGLCKLWTIPDCELIRTLKGHSDRASCIKFHPQATKSQFPSDLNLASCSADGAVFLWDLQKDTPIHSLTGHTKRVSKLAFHPSGRFLATACFDSSWRLWDLDSTFEILHQEGHSNSVYNVGFHPDGSLLGSCGLDAYGRIWDIRTGKCIMLFDGHSSNVLAIDFSPNGVHVATGSDDHSVRIWDLRQRRSLYVLPAHTNLVSHVVFQKSSGNFLITSGYDRTAKAWLHPGWAPLRTLSGHDGTIMCVDVTNDDQCVVTTSYDKTIKLWFLLGK